MEVAPTASPYPYDTMFVDPEPTLPRRRGGGGGGGPVLSDEQVRRWQAEGFLFLKDVWDPALIARAAAEAHAVYPSPGGDVGRAAELARAVAAGETGGSPVPINFPSTACPATNEVALMMMMMMMILSMLLLLLLTLLMTMMTMKMMIQ